VLAVVTPPCLTCMLLTILAVCCPAGRSLDDTLEDVKEVPPIQRGVSSIVSKLSGTDKADRGYPPVKSVDGSQALSSSHLGAVKDVGSGPSQGLLTHRGSQL